MKIFGAIGRIGSGKDEVINYLKGNPAIDFILIHVYVDDPRIRYERLTRRNRPDDPDAYDDLLEQDRREEKLFQIEAAATMADYALNNSGSLEDFHRQLDAQLKDQV